MKRIQELKERQARGEHFRKFENRDGAGAGAGRFGREGGQRGAFGENRGERRRSGQNRDNFDNGEPLRRVNK